MCIVWNQTLVLYCIRVRETPILDGNYESKRLHVVLDSVFILRFLFSSLIGQF